MKAIFYKDFLYNKTLIYWWIFLIIGYSIIFIPLGDFTTEVILSLMFVNNFVLNSLSENFASGWYSFLLATPSKRNQLVNNIYLEGLLLVIITEGFSFIVSIIIALTMKINFIKLFNTSSLLVILLFTFYDLFLLSLDIFISFKFDVKLARTISTVIFLFDLVLFIILANYLESLFFINNPLIFLFILSLCIFLIGFILFYYLTLKTVKLKDF